MATKSNYAPNWHHTLLCAYLDKWVRGEIRFLIVNMPPRHGKSELVSRRLPAYILGREPNAEIIACSYSADLASKMNRDVQRIIDSDEYREIFPDTKLSGKNVRSLADGSYLRNNDIFEIVDHAGYYRSAGVGGGITGMGFRYGIIDDPFKNQKEADSATTRTAIWEWYTSTFLTRAEQDARILITMTRWHIDDIVGRIVNPTQDDDEEEASSSEDIVILNLPAIAGIERHPEDPRSEGDALWPARYDGSFLSRRRRRLGLRQFSAMYQQEPIAKGGGILKREWFKPDHFVTAIPKGCRFVRYWDKAATQDGGAFSAGALLAFAPDGRVFIVDIVKGQWSAANREARIHQTAQADKQRFGYVEIWIEQEPGSGGLESADRTVTMLAGYTCKKDRVSGSKETRAEPFAAQCEVGNVYIVVGPWNEAFLEEAGSFPHGKYKDQVDATSGAFAKGTSGKGARIIV